ncbi:MAG TPA: MauE/DoxX family redox-associated membrane protein [Pirellulales bacterium]
MASLAAGFVLLTAGAAHLGNPYYFITRVLAYDLVGARVALGLALLLPSLEMVLGVCLICRVAPLSAQIVTTVLLATFIAAQGIALARGLKIDCGCFGPAAPQQISATTILRTSALAATALAAAACEHVRTRRGVYQGE